MHPDAVRTSVAAVAHAPIVDHLKKVGLTAVELIPVRRIVQDERLSRAGPAELVGLHHDWLLSPVQLTGHSRRSASCLRAGAVEGSKLGRTRGDGARPDVVWLRPDPAGHQRTEAADSGAI